MPRQTQRQCGPLRGKQADASAQDHRHDRELVNVDEVKRTGRTTQGVTFAKPDKNDEIISIARNEEKDDESAESGESAEKTESAESGTNATVNEGASASSEAATEANAGNGDGENVEA